MRVVIALAFLIAAQNPPAPPAAAPAQAPTASGPLERSAYFAFVDRDYIFTVEVVQAGIPLLNFISMSDKEQILAAKQVRLALVNRKAAARFFVVDTGNPKEPVILPSVRIRPRSSFGVRLQGEFGEERELAGVTIGLGDTDYQLVPLQSFDFENLALKLNKLNLGSPDFRDDWRVLKLEAIGSRAPARRSFPATP